MSRCPFFFALLFLVGFVVPAQATRPFHFPEGKQGKGELRYINGLPVLTVEGTPEQIGEQIGKLAVGPAKKMQSLIHDFLKVRGLDKTWPFLVRAANGMLPQFPEDYRKEMAATARGADIDPNLVFVVNTIPDMMKLSGCSAVVVSKERSATGAPLVGRNLDLNPFGSLHEYSLIIVYRQPNKHTFATIIFPGAVGVASAMNDAGLVITANEAFSANDGSPQFDTKGTPMGACIRRVMEECTTVGEAEKLIRSVKRTTMMSLTVCDKNGGAIFEVTPRSVVARTPEAGICCCTNTFISKELCTGNNCNRLPKLEICRECSKLSVEDIHKKMDEVNQGIFTLQTMVFEPATLQLHLSIGKLPASAFELKSLNLAELFSGTNAKR